jgi:hypothetical protein
MKNVYEVLRQKELELTRLEKEVEALRVAAPLLSEEGKEQALDAPKPTRFALVATDSDPPAGCGSSPHSGSRARRRLGRCCKALALDRLWISTEESPGLVLGFFVSPHSTTVYLPVLKSHKEKALHCGYTEGFALHRHEHVDIVPDEAVIS